MSTLRTATRSTTNPALNEPARLTNVKLEIDSGENRFKAQSKSPISKLYLEHRLREYSLKPTNFNLMKKLSINIAITFLLIFTSYSIAGGIYTWTDKQGEIHYGDRVPQEFKKNASTLKKHSYRAPRTNTKASVDTLQQKLDRLNKRKKEHAEQKESAEKTLVEKNQLKKNCDLARSNLKTIQQRSRVRVKEKNGDYRMLSDEEKTKKENALKKQIKEFCSDTES